MDWSRVSDPQVQALAPLSCLQFHSETINSTFHALQLRKWKA